MLPNQFINRARTPSRQVADSQRAVQATRSLSLITLIAIFVAASGQISRGRRHSVGIRLQ